MGQTEGTQAVNARVLSWCKKNKIPGFKLGCAINYDLKHKGILNLFTMARKGPGNF